MRFIGFLLVLAGCIWCFMNHELIESNFNFSGTKMQAEQKMMQEKTINSFNQSKRINQEQVKKALDGEY